MDIKTVKLSIDTNGKNDIINLTSKIKSELEKSKMKEGQVLIFTRS